MPVSTLDFLGSAEECADSNTEIGYRNAMSRAYYAAYHEALYLAEVHFPDPNRNLRMGEHERLSLRYKAWDKLPQNKSIAIILENMKSQRTLADYAVSKTVSANQAATQIELAKRFITKLRDSVSLFSTSQDIQATPANDSH